MAPRREAARIERLSNTELRHQYELLLAGIVDQLRDEIYLIGAELSQREYQAFRRAALGRHT